MNFQASWCEVNKYGFAVVHTVSITHVFFFTGYTEGTFLLVWRKQTEQFGEEEIELSRYSTATLYEMDMSKNPSKTYLLIKEKDDSPPERDKKVRKDKEWDPSYWH